MKTALTVIRWIVGLLFIFSGLIKANDPLGLSYKMQEFFEVWGWNAWHNYTLTLSLIMNILEVAAGVAVIIGWQMRAVSWLLLLLIIFFTFLTGYALFSGKIKTCGCFGDCLPLSPAQSFGKDIALLVLILLLFFARNSIKSALGPVLSLVILLLVLVAVNMAQAYVLKYLPYIDCLPYKTGNNILEQMKTPAGAVPDSFSIMFRYQKNGKEIEFDQVNFPDDFDSTYRYISRVDKLIKKGNGLAPAIVDFSLQTLQGNDTTAAVFANTGNYIMVLAKDMDKVAAWRPAFDSVLLAARKKGLPVLLVTAEAEKAAARFYEIPILKCDAIVLKTAARVNPTFFLMKGAVIIEKRAYTDAAKIL